MDERLERAEHLLDLRRPDEAERIAANVLAQDPSSAWALHIMSQALWFQERTSEALGVALRAVSVDPGNPDAHRLCSYLLADLRRVPEAIAAATESVRLAPADWTTHVALGRSRLRARGWPGRVGKAALECAENARDLAPHEPAVHNLIGDCYQHIGRTQKAKKAYTQALQLDPTNEGAIAVMARIGVEQSSFRRAGALVSSGLADAPGNKHMQLTHDAVLLNPVAMVTMGMILGGALIGTSFADLTYASRAGIVAAGLAGAIGVLWWVARPLPQGWRSWESLYRRSRGLVGLLVRAPLLAAPLFVAVGALPPSASGAGTALAFAMLGILGVGVLIVVGRGFWMIARSFRRHPDRPA